MITYSEHTLANGLKVLAHRDEVSKLAAVNILYRVGARNEEPSRTGFAHLFEHLMFRGTKNVPDFDIPVQTACGENNAFTTNDYTDYYITLPKDNIETAFWLEADRMTGLDITRAKLEPEKGVVIEEFNQRYLNQPYGEQWLLLRELAYKVHPYRWPTIGLSTDHIREASLAEVKSFYKRYYTPSNAILSVAADLEPEKVFDMAEKWFGGIEHRPAPCDNIPQEPPQKEARRMEISRPVPATQITVAFPMGARLSRDYYLCDLATDILAGGSSSRLYQRLVKEQKIFSAVNAYITGDIDPGMFVVTGQILSGVGLREAEEAIWRELRSLEKEPAGAYELEKVKNKFEASTLFGELNVMNKALNLSFYAMLGDMSLLNGEVAIYRSITPEEIMSMAGRLFRPEKSSTLVINAIN